MNEKQGNRPSLELMPGLFRKETDSGTKITYQWFRGTGSLSLKVFEILLFIGGLIAAVSSLNGILRLAVGMISFFEALMSIIFFLIGILIVYRGVALAINRSVFELNSTNLKVRHSPLPYPGAARLDICSMDVSSVEWQKVGNVSQTGNASGRVSSGYSTTFDVVLKNTTGRTITLLSGLRAREYAFAIAGELSRLLKNPIDD